MSDTRADAEKELHLAEMSSNLEDSLGSALETSFNLPPPPPAPKKGTQDPHAPDAIPSETVAASSEPVEGLDEWKDTLEGYLTEWQAESSAARTRAEATRKKFEDENAAKLKAEKDRIAQQKKAAVDQEKKEKDQLRLKIELEVDQEADKKGEHLNKAQREKKVREAWELIKNQNAKGSAQKKEGETVETDVRGVTDQDVKSVNKKAVKPLSYDPTTSTEPIPPVFQDSAPAQRVPVQADSVTQSRHSATSQAWEEVSGPSTSGSGEDVSPPRSTSDASDIVKVPSNPDRPESSSSAQPQGHGQPPSQPPSLTLSLFTMPSHLTFSRVLAVVGINLVLPFINGVFLGFGEIFAREAVRVGRAVWRGERALFGLGFGRGAGLGGRGTSGVGLSGGF